MADERKIGAVEIDRLYDFLDGLQTSGYTIDPRQYLALSDLLMALIARGDALDDLPLKTLIAPLICSNPAEQQDFYQRFDRWFTMLFSMNQTEIKTGISSPPKKLWIRRLIFPKISRRTSFWVIITIIIILSAGFYSSSNFIGTQLNNNSNIVNYIIIATLLSLVSWRWWIFYQENQYITRKLANQEPVYTKVPVNTYIQEAMPAMQIKPILSALRKRKQIPSSEVDVDRTIDNALNRSNWLEIAYRQRQVIPEYIVLIDRKSRLDQQARFVQEVLAKLSADGVWLHQYEFSGDPRICFPLDRKDTPLHLKDLQTRHPDTRLLIFSGTNELVSPLTGLLQDWIESLSYWHERAILTPDKLEKVLLEELQSRNFAVLPMTFDGLSSLMRAFETHNTSLLKNGGAGLPAQLTERPMRWVGRSAPPEVEVKILVNELKKYLGEKGFYWLCATAVYPELRWELTLHIGSVLKDNFGQPLLNPVTLLHLVRLPWFRFGYLPDWIRLALIDTLMPEQEIQIRNALNYLLLSAFKEDNNESLLIRYSKNSFGASTNRLIKGIFNNAKSESVYKDHIFATFIIKRSTKRLAISFPKFLQKSQQDKSGSILNRNSALSNNINSLQKNVPLNGSKPQSFRKNKIDTRGMLSIVTMLVSLVALTVSMVGATTMVIDIFDDGLAISLNGVVVKIIVLGLAFFFGWGCGLASIRSFGNQVYPIVINLYAWGCQIGVNLLYIKVIQKLYLQGYDALHFWAYLIMLLGGLFVLICLHLLVKGHDLRPFAIPLLLFGVIHLGVIVVRYVFTNDANGWMVIGDFAVFFTMILISALMLVHIGILSPLRDWIDDMFHENNGKGTGKDKTT